jgi:tRNA pseudouridine32 synthase/23S rRNA pseudouridine746 synthase
MTEMIRSLPVIYRDEYLVVVDKPSGLLSVPGLGEQNQDCVISRVQAEIPEARVVHRLDCHTSGLMVLALGDAMQRAMSRLFHDREIGKQYLALVHGHVVAAQGCIDVPVRLDPDNRPYQVTDFVHGKPAQTRWQVIERGRSEGQGCTRLRLIPHTGRTHQLRVHCMIIGHAILGDRLYADAAAAAAAERLMLHAHRLDFIHPETRQRLQLQAECGF